MLTVFVAVRSIELKVDGDIESESPDPAQRLITNSVNSSS